MSTQPLAETTRRFLIFLFLVGFASIVRAQLSVPFEPRLPGGNIKVKGDLVYVANNIVNISSDPNVAYNGGSSNQNVTMAYVDIDGDPTTFSSSSAELNAPSCSAIVYAGLYWGGIYRDTNRDDPYKSVKFKVPGGSYIDIGPSSSPEFEYEQIYDKDGDRDGDGFTDPGVIDVDYLSGVNMTSYLNYANVTHLLTALPNANGEYMVANVVASTAQSNVSAGWTMVVIYENQNSTSKYISTFDGYAAMGSTYPNVNFPFSGFKTVPAPQPVNAVIGASTIDGDRVTGPSMRFRATSSNSWTYLSDAINPSNNVFNSTISNQGSWVDTRNPASHNTLGWDADILKLPNPSNSVLPNDHDSGEILISTSSEGVILFLTTVAVEIIDPDIIVEKKVEDLAGNDITGAGVNLGQSLEYVLRFWNRGNDDAINFSIRDILPDNVGLENIDLSGAPGATVTTDPSNPSEVVFNIPDTLVTEGGNTYEIRIRVKVSDNCHDFVAACSSTIHNTAYSIYDGRTSGQATLRDPSVSSIDNCGFVTVGATNFLLDDLTNCSFESDIQICGANVEITAGSGYDTYTWYRDLNGNGQIDASDTVYTDSDPDSDPTTVLVQDTGTYLVRKESASCGTNVESMNVTRFGNTQVNPIITYFNTLNGDADITNDIQGEIVTCANDGSQLPKIFLCGTNDTQDIILNITDAQSISWEKLDEASCAATNPDCPNNQIGCSWSQVETGNSFTADQEGRYRLVLSYSGGCNSIFYFDVFQNNLDFDYESQDIFCSTNGYIRILNVGSGYGYQLVDTSTNSIVVPYSANNGPNFSIATQGTYRVDFTQLDPVTGNPLEGSCIFSTDEIGIKRKELTLNLTVEPVTCLGQGSVRVQAGQARANYYYELYTDAGSGTPGTLVDNELAQTSSDYTFTGLNAGDYVVVVRTDDGCQETEAFTIVEIPDPEISATTTKQITCTDGLVTLSPSKGYPSPSYLFAIWEKNGSTSYSDISDIPTNEFQRDTIAPGVFNFPSGEEGTYRFVVVDGNNCWSLSNEITMNNLGSVVANAPTIDSEIKCEGSSTGQVTMNVSGGQTPYTYSINNWTTQQTSPTFVNLSPGNYTIKVRDVEGCEDEVSFTLTDPETFKANAGVSSTGTCDINGYSEVRFTNMEGGTAPYQFSFDGGSSFIADDPMDSSVRASLLPPGNHILIAKDSRGCEITLPITIDPPLPVPVFDMDTVYDCDGNGNVTLTADQTIYDYEYTIDTAPSVSVTDGIFTGIAPGTYTITAEYTESNPPNPSVLLHEDFGSGPTVNSLYVQGYTYEDQVGSNTQINDFEYSITNHIVSPFGPWINPDDHTSNGSDPNGRFLVINVGTPTPTQIIYEKTIKDIIPHQDMRISFAAINLLGSGSQLDPDLYVQMRVPITGDVIGEVQTHDIPKDRVWHDEFEFFINPGIYEELVFVLISKKSGNSGNDVAIDDILVEQVPETCPRTMDIPVVIEAGKGFGATIIDHTDISCNGANDGSVSFEVDNFDSVAGFEYSLDGGTTWTTSTVSQVTTPSILGGGSQSVQVRKADDTSCIITLNQTIDEPTVLAVTPSIQQSPTCSDPVGTIKATVTGGTPTYEYALEDGLGNNLVAFPNPTGDTFSGLSAGDYIVLVRDLNGCTTSSPITLNGPDPLTYDVVSTSCYDGGNNATIQLTVNTGNGGYLFQINGGPWQAPSPSTSNTYTFSGLSNGSYTVNVKDAFGCEDGAVPVDIDAQLLVNATVTDVSSCADGSIEINASGGNGTLVYALVPDGATPTAGNFVVTNTFTIDNAMALANATGFDLYVRDNNGVSPYCEYVEQDIIVNPAVEWEINAIAEDPNCNGGNGSIVANVQKVGGGSLSASEITQAGPFTYALYQGATMIASVANLANTTYTFTNVVAGSYEVRITDGLGCTILETPIDVVDPPVLTADVKTEFASGTCTPAFGFMFENYPTSLNGTLQFSHDNGSSWRTSDTFDDLGLTSGDEVYPSIRTVDGSGNTLCRYDLPRYTLSYPLDDLNINVSAVVVNCTDLEVTVQGTAGTAPYIYTYTDDPINFDASTTLTWEPAIPTSGDHTFSNLVPGRTYVFFVKDANNCIKQSTVNVNEIPGVNLPIEITGTVTPSCSGANNGSISFNLSPDVAEPQIRWELFEVGNATPVRVSGGGAFAVNVPFSSTIDVVNLPAGDYYIDVTQVDGSNADTCHGGSENVEVKEQLPITATATATREIGCNQPGLISITNINGGTAPYTFNVTGPAGFTTITGTSQNPIEIPANSPAGDYDVEILDVYGCASGATYTVPMTLTPNPTIDDIQVANCDGSTEVTVTANSAVGNFRYAMVTTGAPAPTTFFDNGGVFANVAAGDYDFYVIDGNGCATAQATFTVHPALQAKAELTKLLDCSASPDATIEIEALQGSGTYDYSVENITASSTEVGKTSMGGSYVEYHPTTAGTYEIKVYVDATADHEACERTFTIVVPDKIEPDFTATPTDVSCHGANDGSIALMQTDNGITPLTYELLDGTSTPVPSGNYTYDAASRTFQGLAPGGYIVRAMGTNSCTSDTAVIPIGEPTPIAVAIPATDVVQFGCASGNNPDNASITVETTSISGGTGTYVRYQFVDPSNNVVQDGTNNKLFVTDLSGGDYTIHVYDDTGCSGTTMVTIDPFDQLLDATIPMVDDISCGNGGETITILALGSLSDSSVGPHDYSFEEVATGTTNTTGMFTGLQVGLHSFRITNIVTGCSIIKTHQVEEIEQLGIDVIKDSPVVCAGDNSQNHLELSGGYSGGFTWTVYNTNGTLADASDDTSVDSGSETATFTGNIDLPKGTYRIEVIQTDFPYCTQETMVTIGGPDTVLDANIVEIGNASCSNDQGRLSVEPTGGVGPYTISIPSLGLGQNNVYSYVFTNLTNGTYTIEVTDAAGCTNNVLNGTIQTVDPLLADIGPATQTLDCVGDADGSITASVTSGGVGTVLYSLNSIENGTVVSTSSTQSSATFNNLKAGTYSINITDDAGCSYTTAEVIVEDPEPVRGDLALSKQLTCDEDAQLTLTASGGTPFPGNVYQWSLSESGPFTDMSGGNTHTFFNIGHSTIPYHYYIRDANGCEPVLSNSITVSDVVPLTVEVDQNGTFINCNGDSTAYISAKASGGLGNYIYGLYYDSGMTSPAAPTNTNGFFDGLPKGTYYVGVTSSDCEWVSATGIVVSEPQPLSISSEKTDVTCMGADDGSIVLHVSGGTAGYQYAISPNLNQFSDDGTFTDLAAGDYTVIVQDANGCFEVLYFTITEPEALTLTLTTEDEICYGSEDGLMTLDIQGGTAPYSTSLNSNQDSDYEEGVMNYSNLPSGTHVIFIKDANGCTTYEAFTINPGVNLEGTVEVIYECDGIIPTNYLLIQMEDQTVVTDLLYGLDSTDPADMVLDSNFRNLTPGDHTLTLAHANGCMRTFGFTVEDFEPLSLELDNKNINEISAQAMGGNPTYTYQLNDGPATEKNTFMIKRTDTYSVTVTDENGCSVTQEIFMEFIDIEIPNFFTPDGDGLNDRWKPKNIEIFPNITISIFDRYGRRLYRMVQDTEGWDGFYNDANLPMGDYWYIIKLNGDEDSREFVGHFTLYR